MAESVLLEDSTIYTRPAAAADTMAASPPVHANGYKLVLDKDLPDISFMTAAEWDTFFAISEAIVPAVVPQTKLTDPMRQLGIPDKEFYAAVDETLASLHDPPPQAKLLEWLAFRAVDEPAFRRECEHSVASAALRMELANFMSMLNTRYGSLLLTGRWTLFHRQPLAVRQQILKNWRSSRLLPLRIVLKSMNALTRKSLGASSRFIRELGGFEELPKNWALKQGYDFQFLQIPDGTSKHTIETDVIIVGSGCGGGVAAKNLAEAGHRVLVADKGYHFGPESFPLTQVGNKHIYENNGLVISKSSAISVAAGETWGGGGTVNWSVCLKPQDYVRREWVAAGLPLFGSAEFDDCIDRVWSAIGAGQATVRHNHQNEVVLDGSRKLGWHSSVCDQNTGGVEHYCGRCHLGCGSNEKRGPAVAFLPDAAEAGAEFIEGFRVERVVFAADGVTATGVEGVWTARSDDGTVHSAPETRRQRRVLIKAKKVVVSAGSLWSPALLQKSGVKNPQIGRNLHLHPAAFLVGHFNEAEPQWEGGIITAYNGEFQNLDKKGHGVKLETMAMLPYVLFAIQPFESGLDSKLCVARMKQLHTVISITRDRDTGRITADPATGAPVIDYDVSAFDAEHSLDGIEAIAKLMYVMGASALYPTIPNVRPFVVARDGDPVLQAGYQEGTDPEFTDPHFAAWLKHLRAVGGKAGGEISYLSAHQMGSCRMSAKPSGGAVDPKGKVWGCENLYVADGSVFPSASGVNPMVTILAIADYISRQLAAELSAA
ncbi:long chain fatty alcohol oxidase [Cordyceps militaris]|nr:long chain fatty alcohol oxidase [Cordyceps militaris]